MRAKTNSVTTQSTQTQRNQKRKKRRMIMIICLSFLLVACIILAALVLYGKEQMKKIPDMSFEDCLTYTLGNEPDARITVGIIQNGNMTYTVYGEDGKELPKELYTYEIGSLTKTFTAALIQKAVTENSIKLDETVDRYIALPADNSYPTIADLLTHTSGYRDYYFEKPMISNFFAGRNDFCGITDKMVLHKLNSLDSRKTDNPFKYSNYSYAVLGLVLEKVYGEEYTSLINGFAEELGLSSTCISNSKNRPLNGWDWNEGDTYLSAGGLVSNIEDMLKYAQLQLDREADFEECHKIIKKIDATTDDNKMLDIRMDSIGMAWITDEENAIIWHNGGTGDYNCYLGFCPESGTAVVILANLKPSYRIPATVMGVKLLKEIQ